MTAGAVAIAPRRSLLSWRWIDVPMIIVLAVFIELLVWTRTGPGDHIVGPRPVMALLPLLLVLPLWWRRSRPLLVCVLVMSGPVVEGLISGRVAENITGVIAAGLAAYAVAAYSTRRRALVGLAVVVAGYAGRCVYDANVRSGRAGELWAAAFFAVYLLALWLVGAVLAARRESIAMALRAAAVEHEAEQAVVEERARIARDLHDIVSHNLSVVVVQAAGGRAISGREEVDTAATLAKIEHSGRQALVEMRRLLGLLRTQDELSEASAALTPVPGVNDIEFLVDGVRAAGLDVALNLHGPTASLQPSVDVAVYRVVQEGLTNALKHAGPGVHVDVTVATTEREVTVAVVDDGPGPGPDLRHGHGLRGMRERIALLDGEMTTAAAPGGGFALTARLPVIEPA